MNKHESMVRVAKKNQIILKLQHRPKNSIKTYFSALKRERGNKIEMA